MDISSSLKSDVLKALTTLVVPGAVALIPYALLLGHQYPDLRQLGTDLPFVASTLAFFAALAAGMVLENLGSILEVSVWDRRLQERFGIHSKDWIEYLKLNPEREPIGQRYLRTVLMRMKFELSFSLALLCFWFGMMWLDATNMVFSATGRQIFSGVTLGVAAFLVWESGKSAAVLANVRHILITGVDCPVRRSERETPGLAAQFDRHLRGCGYTALSVGFVISYMLVEHGRLPGDYTDSVVAGLLIAFGLILSQADLRLEDGVRAVIARHIAFALLLSSVLVGLRILDSRHPSLLLYGSFLAFVLTWLHFRSFRDRLTDGTTGSLLDVQMPSESGTSSGDGQPETSSG